MRSITLLAGGAAVCLLTAGTPSCPNCLRNNCEIDPYQVTIEGEGTALQSGASRLVLEAPDQTATCVVDLPPGLIAPLPNGRIFLSTAHNGACGIPETVVLEFEGSDGKFKPYSECRSPR